MGGLPGPPIPPRGPLWKQAEDLGDQGRVLGAVPGVALEQPRSRVDEEREQYKVGCGQVQRALQGACGGGRVAERIPGHRLQQGSRHEPYRVSPDGTVHDGRERGRRALRVVLGQPEQRDDVAYLGAPALACVQLRDGAFDLPRLAEQDERLQHVRPQRRGQGMRRDQRLGQLPGGPEGGDRVGVMTAGHVEAPASVVEMHPDGRFHFRLQGARGAPEPPLSLGQPPLGDHRAAEHRVGHGDERLVAPAVLFGQVNRLPAAPRSARVGPQSGEFRPVRQSGELEIRPPDPVRKSRALLQVLVRVLEAERPDFGDAEADQRQRSQVLAQAELRFVQCLDGREQPVRRLGHRRQVAPLPGQVQPQDREHDVQAAPPDRGTDADR